MNLKKANLKGVLSQMTSILKAAGDDEAALDASLMLMKQLKLTKTELYSKDSIVPDENDLRKLEYMLKKRSEGCPMQYLLGKSEFMGLSFKVRECTLIPRPDTETLVEKVLEISKKRSYKTGLDIGTGSGAIAISLAHYNKSLKMTATDIWDYTLMIAAENAKDHSADIRFIVSDLFENIEGKFDFIVSNPPYIKTEVIPTLEKNVRNYEPILALDGGFDGLSYYRKIIEKAPLYLNEGGMLAFEIGYDQGEAVSALMNTAGFKNVEIIKDLANLDRVVIGFKKEQRNHV